MDGTEPDRREDGNGTKARGSRSIMAHKPASMASMKDPTEGLSEIIRRVEDTWDMVQHDMTSFLPILNGKMLYGNMTSSVSGLAGINHFDSGIVILIKNRGAGWRKAKFRENCTQIDGGFGGRDGG